MKTSASQSGLFNPRALLARLSGALCSVGGLLAMLVALAASGMAYPRPGSTEPVSVGADGTEGNNSSYWPSVSADGRYFAFASDASNLVPDDNNGARDVFVHDRELGATERVSVVSNGAEGNNHSELAHVSADGRYVAFHSLASNLVPGDTNGATDVFVHDREIGATERVSVGVGGAEANDLSVNASISADGRYVAFAGYASNVVPGDNNGTPDIFVHDREAGATERVSVASDGTQANNQSGGIPSISSDGRYVAFDSYASNLVSEDTNGFFDVFVHDRLAGTTERVSMGAGGAQGNGHSTSPFISANGRYVAFYSEALNLVPVQGPAGALDVFVHDREAGATEQVSVRSDGMRLNGYSAFPSISADGRYVAFQSSASFEPGIWDVFVRDRNTGTTELLSVGTGGTQGNSHSYWPRMSADGRYVAFYSLASNLAPGDTNGVYDVFVRDRGRPIGVGPLVASCNGGSMTVLGWATFSGSAVASADDPAGDGAPGAVAAGGELTRASLLYRPEDGDLLVRHRVASLPPAVGGAPGVLYGLKLTVGAMGIRYEVRAAGADAMGSPYFALYHCEPLPASPTCTQVAALSGSMGTTGAEVLVSVPLTALGVTEGVTLSGLLASTALGDATSGPTVMIDDIPLDATSVPVRSISLGIAPAGTPESQVTFDTPATLAGGNFSGTLDVSSLSPGDYEVLARACLGATCGPAVSSPLTACPSVQLNSVVSRKIHGSAGTLDISLPLAGSSGIECRGGGVNGEYTLIFTFANTLTSVLGVSVTSGTGSVSSSVIGSDAHQYIVNLTGVTNAQIITVTLTNVNDTAGNTRSAVSASMGVLLGDTTANSAVNSSDISQTKGQSGRSVTTENFRQDVSVNGSINSSDISLVKSKSGTALP